MIETRTIDYVHDSPVSAAVRGELRDLFALLARARDRGGPGDDDVRSFVAAFNDVLQWSQDPAAHVLIVFELVVAVHRALASLAVIRGGPAEATLRDILG